ncbi:MAM and LDL-receptor class A domain-containing protein 1-like [Hyposmocoma kahamanoa]|uniref:MAM and LDL-receptor class A domain-containing protein 1-like n=1 Tax=Hyposmocoma kahamanoa TaxID=1477025 RepID=UPI000E6D5BDE|nr:MAM and LDL-receptor class A domain-containing protein 1-like [Hyposmocoma kahamanoa]
MCPYPRLSHGRIRMRQKSKLVKFICFPGYTLVGNKYATCRDGEWDVPMPVCIKPGCTLPDLGYNVLAMQSHSEAWVVFFCFPGYELSGSSTIFCDGKKWNDTVPTCGDAKTVTKLSCDFEESNNCGWVDDELHDFDWKRLNKKTPSSFLNTGPSFDHTYGEGGSGHYMYIESTSRLENDTARLISPLYESSLAKDGCFSFFYHMFGQGTGGLRVYQKPESLPMLNVLHLNIEERQKYLLFEKWGNQGDFWYEAVTPLRGFSESFQIIIEGIRGRSYTSDIAIDDVSILQGENCTAAMKSATTPVNVLTDSCTGRCESEHTKVLIGCGCNPSCETDSNCCPDYYEICVFSSPSTDDDMPETQKLVLWTTTTTNKPTTTPETTPTTTTTQEPTTTTLKTTSTTPKTTTKPTSTTTKRSTTIRTTTKIPTLIFKTTPKIINGSGIIIKSSTKIVKPVTTTSTKRTTKVVTTVKPQVTMVTKRVMKKENVELGKDMLVNSEEPKSHSSSLKSTILTIAGLVCLAGMVWLVVLARGARGREILSRLRGHAVSDSEVRYLNSDVDDD